MEKHEVKYARELLEVVGEYIESVGEEHKEVFINDITKVDELLEEIEQTNFVKQLNNYPGGDACVRHCDLGDRCDPRGQYSFFRVPLLQVYP